MAMQFLTAAGNGAVGEEHRLDAVVNLLRTVSSDRRSVVLSAVTTVIEALVSASPEQIASAAPMLTGRESTDIEFFLTLADIAAASSHRDLTRHGRLVRYDIEATLELRKSLEEVGGTIDRKTVAALRNVGEKSIDKAVRTRRILAVPSGQGRAFPVWQFEHGDMVPGFVEALQALPEDSPWEWVEFFLTPVDDLLDGMPPIEALKKRQHVKTVLRLARTHLDPGAV